MLSFYKKMIALRQSQPSLLYGRYEPVYSDHQMIAYIRRADNEPAFLIVLNLTHRPCYFKHQQKQFNGKIVLATVPEMEGATLDGPINLSGDEGIVVQLNDQL